MQAQALLASGWARELAAPRDVVRARAPRRAGCVAEGERVAGGIPQQRHSPRVAGRLGVHDLRRDLA